MPKSVIRLPQRADPTLEHAYSPPIAEKIIKNIAFFGDSSIPEDGDIFKSVYNSAKLLAEHGYAIVNGGGPGVMKAATEGAESVGGHTVAVYWEPKLASIFEGKNLQNHTDESATYSNYMMRTMGLIEKGHVFVVCPGGTGTISEWGMVWALAKLYYGKHKPVILFGDFWKAIITQMQKGLLLDDNELGVLHYASTKEEVLELVQSFELEVNRRARKTYEGDEIPFVLAPKYDQVYVERMTRLKSQHLHRVPNLITKAQLEEFHSLVQPPARVLDVGVGGGYDLSYLSQYYSVTGLEIDEELIEIARFENPNADILEMDVRKFEIQENVFKGIWARDSLHHLNDEDLNMVFTKLARGLVPGGILYAIVRAGDQSIEEEDMHAGRVIKRYYNQMNEAKVTRLAEANSLTVKSIKRTTRSHDWLAVVLQKPE